MNEQAKKLFLENYSYEGDCKGLLDQAKKIEKEFRRTGVIKTIYYLHWALVERIFRLQGGTFEVKSWNFEVPFTSKNKAYDNNGEITETESVTKAYFLHLSATWQDTTLDEYYPIFDNQTSRIIALPDAQDLNTAKQRGMVRLIARISGIGLSIFEQIEDQFNKDDDETTKVKPAKKAVVEEKKFVAEKNKTETPKPAVKPVEMPVEKPKAVEKPKPVAEVVEDDSNAFLEMMQGKVVAPQFEVEVEEDFGKETEQYAEKKLEIKKYIANHRKTILEYMASKGKSLLGDLSYKELVELETIVKVKSA